VLQVLGRIMAPILPLGRLILVLDIHYDKQKSNEQETIHIYWSTRYFTKWL
jgi:hypothetical protein